MIHLMLVLFKAPFSVLHFSCYTLMTFLMMLSLILVSVLMILFSKCDQTSIRHSRLGRKCLVDFNAGKTQLVLFDWSNNSAVSFEPLAHCQNVASLSFFYRWYFGRCSFRLVPLLPSQGRSTCPNRLHDFLSPFLYAVRVSVTTVSFLALLDSGVFCL